MQLKALLLASIVGIAAACASYPLPKLNMVAPGEAWFCSMDDFCDRDEAACNAGSKVRMPKIDRPCTKATADVSCASWSATATEPEGWGCYTDLRGCENKTEIRRILDEAAGVVVSSCAAHK